MTVRCKHGMRTEFCSVCTPAPLPASVPRHVTVKQGRVLRERTPPLEAPYLGGRYALVHVAGPHFCGHVHAVEHLTTQTEVVHLHGHPYVWVVEAVLAQAPNLRRLQVIPSMVRACKETVRTLCAARGVQIVAGHHRPDLAWAEDEIRHTPLYGHYQRFLRGLAGIQYEQFQELLVMGFEAAQLAARYYCLASEAPITLRVLADDHGLESISGASSHIHAVFYYLDSSIQAGKASVRLARNLYLRVVRLRPLLASVAALDAQLRAHGVTALPAGFPLSRLDIYLDLVAASRDGRLASLKADRPKAHQALILRFGLEGEFVYRTLREVAVLFGGVTREWIRLLETQGLTRLNIVDEDTIETTAIAATDVETTGPEKP